MSANKMFVSIQGEFMPLGLDALNEETGKGQFSGETLEQIKQRHPNAILMDLEEFHSLRENAAKSEPVKISEEGYFNAFECLPALDYVHRGESESFKMEERYVGRITSVYARIGATFWSFNDVDTITHQEILARIAAAVARTELSVPA